MIWSIIKNVQYFLKKARDDHINVFAAQTAFFIILSFIPFMMVFSSMLRYTPITEAMLLEGITRTMPDYIAPLILTVVDEVYGNSMGLISVTAVAAIWSAAKGIQYLSDGLNSVNGVDETRNWLVLRIRAVFYTFIFLILIMVMLLILVFGSSVKRMVVQYVPVTEEIANRLYPFRFLIIIFTLIAMFAMVYKALPNNKPAFWAQLPGATISAVAWYVFSLGLSIYVKYFNGFSMYGSLTTIALLMLWLYFCIYIFLLCGEVNDLYGRYFTSWVRMRRERRAKRG